MRAPSIFGAVLTLVLSGALIGISLGRLEASAALLALTGAMLPSLPPRPRTRTAAGPALVTAVLLGAGWLGVGIFQLIRAVPSPGGEHWTMACALAGLPLAAARVGRSEGGFQGDGSDEAAPTETASHRLLALERFLIAALLMVLSSVLVVVAHRHDPSLVGSRLKGVRAVLMPLGGAVALRLALDAKLTWALLRRPRASLLGAVLTSVAILALAIVTAVR